MDAVERRLRAAIADARPAVTGFLPVGGWDPGRSAIAHPADSDGWGMLSTHRVYTVFDEVFLANTTYEHERFSRALVLWGNTASLTTLIINKAGVRAARFWLQGSFDGCAWTTILSQSHTSWGYLEGSGTNLAYTYVRVRASLDAGAANQALFSCYVAMARL